VVINKEEGKKVSILGVTGTIGQYTADVIQSSDQPFDVKVVSACYDVKGLAHAAMNLHADHAVIADDTLLDELNHLLAGTNINVSAGKQALLDACTIPCDVAMCAISGAVALEPLMNVIKQGNTIALANKEAMVCAGSFIKQAAKISGSTILPVDSEHNAIFQLLDGRISPITKLTLTASGGPFRGFSRERLLSVSATDALKHPNWSMGQGITIDSATLMNKGLEVIEAYHFFNVTAEQIDVLVHPQSVIHGLIHYADGSVMAGLSSPDMRVPIAHTLSWPSRGASNHQELDLLALAKLEFEPVDHENFPALKLAFETLKEPDILPLIYNTANEVARDAFIAGRIGFLDVTRVVSDALHYANISKLSSIDEILDVIQERKKTVEHMIVSRSAA
tara:strand:- start:13 stop:1191 length:1179 start_codon:yes stop_codon:yes gene_type:complete